jgi:esterase/lipase
MTTPPPHCGVLLLHGFTGNPDSMRPLQAPLEALGVEVSLPALIQQSHGDPTVLDASAVTLLSGLGTPASDKRIVWLQRSGHELLQAVDRAAVIEAVVGFVGERMQRQWLFSLNSGRLS